MGSFIGDVTDAIGLTNHGAEKDAANAAAEQRASAAKQQAIANQYTEEAVEFQKEQYEDWKSIYGEVQDNLGDYYNSLSADTLAATNLQAQQTEFQSLRKQLEQTLEQRGLGDSKFATSQEMSLAAYNASQRTAIRAAAPGQAAAEKLGFLGVGLGQGTAMLGNVASTSLGGASTASSGANMYAGMGSNLLSSSTAYGTANIQSMSSLANTVAKAAMAP